jgi:hypothetical protein
MQEKLQKSSQISQVSGQQKSSNSQLEVPLAAKDINVINIDDEIDPSPSK